MTPRVRRNIFRSAWNTTSGHTSQGDSLAALSPNVLTRIEDAQVADDGTVLWATHIDEFDPLFQLVVLSDESVAHWSGYEDVGGSRRTMSNAVFSPNARFMAATLSAGGTNRTLVRIEPAGTPIACGASADQYEPNDDCASATMLPPTFIQSATLAATASQCGSSSSCRFAFHLQTACARRTR